MATLEIEGIEQHDDTLLNIDLRDTINTVLTQKHFNLPSDRCRKLQEFGSRLVSALITNQEAVSQFSAVLLSHFDEILNKASSKAHRRRNHLKTGGANINPDFTTSCMHHDSRDIIPWRDCDTCMMSLCVPHCEQNSLECHCQ